MMKGLRVVGILAMAMGMAHCGGNEVNVSTGPGVVPLPGTFNGTLRDSGGSIRIEVGSIDSVAFDCDNQQIQKTFTPPGQIDSDGTFDLKFSTGNRDFRIRGTFRDNNNVDGTIDDGDNKCDDAYDAGRSGSTPTPVLTPTPGHPTTTPGSSNPTETLTPGPGDTVTVTPTNGSTGPTRTATPGPSVSPCPVAVEVVGNAAVGKPLDSGWTGLAHNATVVSDGKLTFTISNCDSQVRPCGDCDVGGPIQNLKADKGDINAHRCSNDTSIECANDAACTAPGKCAFFFGAPLPLSAGGVASCVVNQVDGPVSGTANIENGAFASTLNLIARVALGQLDSPCPKCTGDPTLNDGNKGGTCSAGARNGQPCDANGTSPIPSFGTTSLDCAPASFVSAISIDLAGSSGTVTKTLTASSPNCSGNSSKKCFCPNAGPAPAQPNACLDDTTTPGDQGLCRPISVSSPKGECPATGETYCVPLETFRGCGSDSDCHAPGDTCQAVLRPCYLDNGVVGGSVSAIGMADPPTNGTSHPTFAALFCVPPVASVSIDTAAGLPGLGRLQLPLTTTEILTLP
jgi:hypothetical protein